MDRLHILYISPEVVPFAKTGGLADVSGFLPKVIADLGHTVKVVMPKYAAIPEHLLRGTRNGGQGTVRVGKTEHPFSLELLEDPVRNLEYVFISQDKYFNRPALYSDPDTGSDYTDNDERFIFFSQAALEAAKILQWPVDIFHANDWQAALVPTYLKTAYKDDPFYSGSRALFTIHNMAFQGLFPEATFSKLNLPDELFYSTGPFEYWKQVNFMKAAISFSDIINTVSERYAVEIQSSSEFGCGLEGVLRARSEDVYGILNGVDYSTWSPNKDSLIPAKFTVSNLSGKRTCKVELLNRLGLPLRDEAPLFGMITRLTDQKGFDIFAEIADEFLTLNTQLVILGTGDKKYHDLLTDLETQYPDKVKAVLRFDNEMAHWIEAGADAFLMPSRFEPSGLNQLYSLRYGTVPIVRATGGLYDTIADVSDDNGTGFVFLDYEGEKLLEAITRALELFGKKRKWRAVVKNGMKKDYSWNKSAEKYIDLYRKALTRE